MRVLILYHRLPYEERTNVCLAPCLLLDRLNNSTSISPFPPSLLLCTINVTASLSLSLSPSRYQSFPLGNSQVASEKSDLIVGS